MIRVDISPKTPEIYRKLVRCPLKDPDILPDIVLAIETRDPSLLSRTLEKRQAEPTIAYIDKIVDAYLQEHDNDLALNFLRNMIFFDGTEEALDRYIARYLAASADMRPSLATAIVWRSRMI